MRSQRGGTALSVLIIAMCLAACAAFMYFFSDGWVWLLGSVALSLAMEAVLKLPQLFAQKRENAPSQQETSKNP